MEADEYLTLNAQSKGVYKDRKSKFIGIAIPIKTETDVKNNIKNIKKEYNDANHHCYAYSIGINKQTHCSNDGEPNSTAGIQILNQINSKNLTNVLIIVVRYFGGIKLGVPGLINSYRTATLEAINNGIIVSKFEKIELIINFNYSLMNNVMSIIKEYSCNILSQNFETDCSINIELRMLYKNVFLEKLNNIKELKITVK